MSGVNRFGGLPVRLVCTLLRLLIVWLILWFGLLDLPDGRRRD